MSIPKVSVHQVKAARALLGWSQTDLAASSKISEPTIKRLESQGGELGGRPDTIAKIVATLKDAGVEFMNGDGVRMKA